MNFLDFLKEHQLNIMLFMSGICAVLALLALVTGALSPRRRKILCLLELTAMVLLMSDRFSYIYRGDLSSLGFWMVRICNFLVYFCTIALSQLVTLYICDLYSNEGGMKTLPKRLFLCKIFFAVGVALLVISQFTGLYYTFDAQNLYQRAPLNPLSYVMPFLILILQLTVVIQYRKLLSRTLTTGIMLDLIIPAIASVIQFFAYGLSLTNMTAVGLVIILYIYALIDLNESLKCARLKEIEIYKEAHRREHTLFEQTAEALASAIDAKDQYTHGHSARVAQYSVRIAQEAGMSEEECEMVYFAALLHDVGKIGVDDAIINKEGKLTDEEFAQIKLHPVYGNQILSSIQESPYLSIGARYHHERCDGRGYPDGLIGEDIPEIARIIAVADAYDAMTSKRSYRDIRPQHVVREELLKCTGTQFDPKYAEIMLHLIDHDLEYQMHEQKEGKEEAFEVRMQCDSIYHECSTGIHLTDSITRIRLFCRSIKGYSDQEALPSLILFDSLDGRVHEDGPLKKDFLYFEYGQIRFDGRTRCTEARKAETKEIHHDTASKGRTGSRKTDLRIYDIEAVRVRDHVQIRISDGSRTMESIVALPDNGRFSYISLTGEHCIISNIRVEQEQQPVDAGYIRRIAEEVSYIRGCPEGDIPNIQIDGWRMVTSRSVPVTGRMRFTFHARTLPTARLVWHCPFFSIFTSQDGSVTAEDFREFVLIRLDGENWESDAHAQNEVNVERTKDFAGWNAWKESLRAGMDCEIRVEREGNVVTITTENLGIEISSVTTIRDEVDLIYAALTGDQCTITNIHILREE